MPELHAEFSPSGLQYLKQCPNYRSEGTSFAAEEGTMMHEAAETGDLSKCNDEQAAQVQMCLDYVKDLAGEDSKVYHEVEVYVEDITWGTSDVVMVTGDHVDIIDFKFGRSPVPDASENLQGFAYLCGAWNHPHAKHCTTGTVHFLLPRRDEISTAKFVRDKSYNNMIKEIGEIVARAESGRDKLFSGGPQCRYCSRKSECPVMVGNALAVHPSTLPKIKLDSTSLQKPETISQLLDMKPIFEDFFKQVTKRAMQMVDEQGLEIPGYEERFRSAPRTIKDVTAAWDIVQQYGVDLQDFLDGCSIKIGALDTAVKHAAARENKPKGETVRSVHEDLTLAGLETSEGEIKYLKKTK